MNTATNSDPQIQALLNPEDNVLLLIDHQAEMVSSVQSLDRQLLISNATALAKMAKLFKIPTILTTIAAESTAGPLIPEIRSVFPDKEPIDRNKVNAWEDKRVVTAVKQTGRKKLLMAGFGTADCLALPALAARQAGYEVVIVTDASSTSGVGDHDRVEQCLTQAGVVVVKWDVVLLEYLARLSQPKEMATQPVASLDNTEARAAAAAAWPGTHRQRSNSVPAYPIWDAPASGRLITTRPSLRCNLGV
jgi:nicotinamidase-related amidase